MELVLFEYSFLTFWATRKEMELPSGRDHPFSSQLFYISIWSNRLVWRHLGFPTVVEQTFKWMNSHEWQDRQKNQRVESSSDCIPIIKYILFKPLNFGIVCYLAFNCWYRDGILCISPRNCNAGMIVVLLSIHWTTVTLLNSFQVYILSESLLHILKGNFESRFQFIDLDNVLDLIPYFFFFLHLSLDFWLLSGKNYLMYLSSMKQTVCTGNCVNKDLQK